jgi:hypothetical protein
MVKVSRGAHIPVLKSLCQENLGNVVPRPSVLVSSSSVAHPVAVRFAWAMNPSCNLYNRAGLPAASFRTDDWEAVATVNAFLWSEPQK